MSRKFIRLFGMGLLAASLSAGAAHAQLISDTNDYTLSWTGSNFGSPSTLYSVSFAYGADPFGSTVYNISIPYDATNLSLFEGGGVTISSPSLTPSPPYTSPIEVTFSNSGALGDWGLQYNTAAPLTVGTLGSLPTLTFTSYDGVSFSGIGYYVFAHIPGDWTTEGTSPGDHTNVSVAAGFTTPVFRYSGGVTTVETFTSDYPGSVTSDLTFILIGGSPVPEPSAWAMMLIGFGGIGFWRFRRARAASATA